MRFNEFIDNILKEELSKEDRIKALKSIKPSKQYVVIQIGGQYLNSFGSRKVLPEIRDFMFSHHLHQYKEWVIVHYDTTSEAFSDSKEAILQILNTAAVEGDWEIASIHNPSKDTCIIGVEKEYCLYVAFPLDQTDILDTFLKSVDITLEELIDNPERIKEAVKTSNGRLAQYFLRLPGNQSPSEHL
jgi:hypothetical protein